MSKGIDFGSDEEFIANYEKLKSSRKMGELYNCDKSSVLNHAKKIGYDTNSNKTTKLSEKDKEEIRQSYYTKTSTELAKKYNVSRGMITKIWYDANLKGKEVKEHIVQDLVGQTFGFLTVTKRTSERNAGGSVIWLCLCNCGLPDCKKTQKASSTELKNGSKISCGAVGRSRLKIGQGLNFNDLTNKVFGKLTVLQRIEDKIYDSGKKDTQWLCQCECGNLTKVISSNLVTGNTQSCGLCKNNSHGNIKIANLLKENNISFEQEKRFDSCKDKHTLPFDFYVENKYLIEYDGRQHFSQENSLFDYESTHKHDIMKSQWCKNNNIPLIRIPYTHYDELCIDDLKLESSKFIEK